MNGKPGPSFRLSECHLAAGDFEPGTSANLPYETFLELADIDGLRAYLGHPAHEEISTRFFAALEETLIYDFEMEEGLGICRS